MFNKCEQDREMTIPLFTRIQHSDEVIQAGLYMVYYDQGNYDEMELLYRNLLEAIDQDGYEVDGPFYEEYLLHELTPGAEDQYLTKFFCESEEKSLIEMKFINIGWTF